MMKIVNPMLENFAPAGVPAPRLAALQGRRIALLDISKPGGSHFLDRLESILKTRYGAAAIVRETKPTFSKPAPASLIEKLRGADAVIEALAD
jgi:hypothetical protein